MERIVEVKNLSKNFDKFEAVKNISFAVDKGDVFGFLGPNGSGKSTTIRCLLSLIKPTSGSIKIFDKSFDKDRNFILSNIGSIIEKPDFYKYLSAEQNLKIFARISGANIPRTKVSELLEFVGLKGREKDLVKGFSHGMKQRLGIAQTLLHNPELIILDEPTTGLDPQGIIELRNLIISLNKDFNKTIILSSHILSEIELIANKFVIINKGKSLVEGLVSELLNHDSLLVNIELDNIEKAIDVLKNSNTNPIIIDSRHINISISKNEIPSVINKLSAAGVFIYGLDVKRKLEDYFLKIIQQS